MRKQNSVVEQLPERLWTIKETAAFLNVPVGTLYQWRHRGEGPEPYKAGGHLRYNPQRVMRWLESTRR